MGFLTIIPIILMILVPTIFIFVFGMLFSPKFRNKYMERQLKAEREYLIRNEGLIKELEKRNAEIEKIGVGTKARAIKEGLAGDDGMFCKHCGASIDGDSTFCKKCGKKQ